MSDYSSIGFGVAIVAILVSYKPKMIVGGVAFLLPIISLGFLYLIISNRQAAFPEAMELLKTLESEGSVVRTKNYDLFLPKTMSKAAIHVILFIPGALVSYEAYAGVASRVADQGIAFAVLSMEPIRLPSFLTGASLSRVKRLASEIQSKLLPVDTSSSEGDERKLQWNLGGHSMGASQSVTLFPGLLQENDVESSTARSWNKLVVCGVAGCVDDPTGTLDHDNALIIQGSNDGFATFFSEEKIAQNKNDYTYLEIPGGNHAGIAHYGPQTFPMRDGERSIKLEDQQRQTADAIVQFVLGRKVRGARRSG